MEKTSLLLLDRARAPKRRSLVKPLIILSLVCLVGLYHGPHWPSFCHRHRHRPSFGRFPKPDDPFRFIPCTKDSVPPALNDTHPERSWAKLFDSDPRHWSWGNKTDTSDNGKHHKHGKNPYAGRGIYLCGYLDVPLDYTNGSDARISRLAVTKYQASGLAPRKAASKSERTLVVEPGGPGGSGTSLVWRSGEEFSRRFTDGKIDVLGWDPRGVNMSLPSLSCFPHDADRDRWSLKLGQYREESASPRKQLEYADTLNDAVFLACKERLGDFPRFVSTAFVARDLDRIRIALGESDLSGYFISYGTGIGQTYASMFPDKVGRLMLDGTEYVRDHRELGGFGWTALDNGTHAWHYGFLGECVNAGPDHCALAKPTQSAVTLDGLSKRMDTLITSLIDRPLPAYTNTSGPSLITYSGIVGLLYQAMYNAKGWPAVAEMLSELEQGNTTLAATMMDRSAWEYDPTRPHPPGTPPATDELGSVVICSDQYDAEEPFDKGAAMDWYEGLWANMTEASWIAGNSRFMNIFPCRHFSEYWTPAEVYRGPLNHTLKTPVLLIAETYDPATPLRNGRRLLAEMGRNARLIAHHGYGHSSRDSSNCTESIARRYIMDGVLPDEAETKCYADEKPYKYGVKDALALWDEHVAEMKVLAPLLH